MENRKKRVTLELSKCKIVKTEEVSIEIVV